MQINYLMYIELQWHAFNVLTRKTENIWICFYQNYYQFLPFVALLIPSLLVVVSMSRLPLDSELLENCHSLVADTVWYFTEKKSQYPLLLEVVVLKANFSFLFTHDIFEMS